MRARDGDAKVLAQGDRDHGATVALHDGREAHLWHLLALLEPRSRPQAHEARGTSGHEHATVLGRGGAQRVVAVRRLDHGHDLAGVDGADAQVVVPVAPRDHAVLGEEENALGRQGHRLVVDNVEVANVGRHVAEHREAEARRVREDGRRSRARALLRVRLGEELLGRLAELVDNVELGLALELVGDRVNVDRALVRQRIKEVAGGERRVALLLEAEDEVDPVVQALRHVVALERLPVLLDEAARLVGPRRQEDVVDALVVLLDAHVKVVLVDEQLRQAEHLGYQLLDVGRRLLGRQPPRLLYRVERAVGNVEAAVLELDEEARERLDAHQKVQHDARVRVVRAVVVRARVVHLLGLLVHVEELLQPIGVLCAHRLAQLAERRRRREIQALARVVGQQKRKHRILREVVERAARQRVEVHQVLKVAHQAAPPLVRDRHAEEHRATHLTLIIQSIRKVHFKQLSPSQSISQSRERGSEGAISWVSARHTLVYTNSRSAGDSNANK